MTARADRGDTHHEQPLDPSGLAGFPARRISGTWYRCHADRGGADHGCWYFSSAGDPPAAFGRFDLPAPRGTCYVANTREAAVRERLGTQVVKRAGRMSVLEAVLTTQDGPVVVTEAGVSTTRSANLPVKAADRWITRSLWSGTGIYSITQDWAAAFDRAGFDSIVYPPRFTLGRSARSLAVFGPSGVPSRRRPAGASVPVTEVLAAARIEVVRPPVSAASSTLRATAPPPAL
ncbi:RES domain-containing protein [Nocardioides marmoriginsengisoli]|uniref:RES domain-containing protein n=1 Tax=Nocardioides marmoriginsengisoli TaxID=661483 RepID=UPI00160DD727|nr:RES domain-containing protein [Nocardioides marmoriginsengisoli]